MRPDDFDVLLDEYEDQVRKLFIKGGTPEPDASEASLKFRQSFSCGLGLGLMVGIEYATGRKWSDHHADGCGVRVKGCVDGCPKSEIEDVLLYLGYRGRGWKV